MTSGAESALAGRVMGQFGPVFGYAVAAVPLLIGLHLMGWPRLPIGTPPDRVIRSRWFGTLGAGFLLSLALTPCGTPVLSSVLAYVAYKGSIWRGAFLLFAYGVVAGLPVILVGTTANRLKGEVESVAYGLWAEQITASATIFLGLFLLWRA